MKRSLFTFAAALALAGSLDIARADDAAKEILIGAAIPLSGPAAPVSGFIKWGYEHALAEVNAKGGLLVDGVRHPVKLLLRDDKTDPSVSVGLVESLISRDHVVAMLGSASPALVNPDSIAAERHKLPTASTACPVEAFKSAHLWKYSWCLFFDEPDLASASLRAIRDLGVSTNKKIAILHDNGPDGAIVGGQMWPKIAKDLGFEVVASLSFPVDNTQFTSIIEQIRSRQPDIVLGDAATTQAILIRKQLAAAGFTPKILVLEKGAEPVQFSVALGKLADGVMVGGFWDPSFPFPGAKEIWAAYEKETGATGSQQIAGAYTAAKVLLDSIEAANSLDPQKINAAIAKTDKTYVVGPVKFDEGHASKFPMAELQWQNGKTVVVWPKAQASGAFLFPMPAH
jgi:branched-chain amino acid transport system substrate-binding protein